MTRFLRVIEILDAAVGGPAAPVGFHGAIWRDVTRDQFVAHKVFGLPVVQVGDGAASNLVKALKGEAPFGADLPVPPPGAAISRMPSGLPPVPEAEIAFIEQWIDDGCPEDPWPPSGGAPAGVAGVMAAAGTPRRVAPPAPVFAWRKTNAPAASSRTDDFWFTDAHTGWAVNSDGNILHTADGGNTWVVQRSAPGSYLRCVAFANANVGWVGALSGSPRLVHTTDGGATWSGVTMPAGAPVAICGLSVVSDQVVYAAGTNRPTDVPRMMKTVDGGTTWTAWDMSAHASVLIDVFFTSASHGWVVGGKAPEPNPTTRNKLKPVVLETNDGGTSWTNRLAGHEALFPNGEWGWKIQFLSGSVGFVSLENFTAGAILRTDDGGVSWTRLPINDPQGNANLEGVGFIDGAVGWVGGWGSEDFSTGFTSGTTDSGATWFDANDVGQFINRFRFIGNPVTVGYASGLTVYKYSTDPVPVAPAGLAPPVRPLLPVAVVGGAGFPVEVPINLPAGVRRFTLRAWDRFGVDVGTPLDELHPQPGARTYSWQGLGYGGNELPPGQFVIRAIADDATASSIVNVGRPRPAPAIREAAAAVKNRTAGVAAVAARKTIAGLLAEPDHDLAWLKDALQIALQLELFTLPPYLTARWTIKSPSDFVSRTIREVRTEEMNHFGLACNMLVAIGGTPLVADAAVVPKYPGPMPGGVRPSLQVTLKRLSREQAAVFMDIEYPQGGPIALAATPTFNSIGEFYAAVLTAFEALNPPLDDSRQYEGSPDVFKVETMADVRRAIELINLQGEGSNASPHEGPDDLAHYYRFAEIHYGKRLVQDAATGAWSFSGDIVPLPDIWPMADIPVGGYQQADVPDAGVWDLITRFDGHYSQMLKLLQRAWEHGNPSDVGEAVGEMMAMGSLGRMLVQKPKPDGSGNYGPCFRFVP